MGHEHKKITEKKKNLYRALRIKLSPFLEDVSSSTRSAPASTPRSHCNTTEGTWSWFYTALLCVQSLIPLRMTEDGTVYLLHYTQHNTHHKELGTESKNGSSAPPNDCRVFAQLLQKNADKWPHSKRLHKTLLCYLFSPSSQFQQHKTAKSLEFSSQQEVRNANIHHLRFVLKWEKIKKSWIRHFGRRLWSVLFPWNTICLSVKCSLSEL